MVASQQQDLHDWVIKKTIFHHHQNDGSIIQKEVFHCPCSPCEQEFQDLAALFEHVAQIHTMSSTPETPERDDSSTCVIEEIRLSNGENRLVCPACNLQFATSAYDKLCEHAAREHGWFLDAGEQDSSSESMDLLFQGAGNHMFALRDIARSRLHVISLGSYCSVKLSIQHMGLGEAHLPFDWIRTSSAGIQHFLNNEFEDFFSVACKRELEHEQGIEYRSKYHTFVHDDITKQTVRQKLARRIERFLALKKDSNDLLFVRACASTEELDETENLYTALTNLFGCPQRRVLLALILDGQVDSEDTIRHASLPGVIFIPHVSPADMSGPVYCKAIETSAALALEASVGSSGARGFGLNNSPCSFVQSGAALLTSKALKPCCASYLSGVPALSFTDHVDLSLQPDWPLPALEVC